MGHAEMYFSLVIGHRRLQIVTELNAVRKLLVLKDMLICNVPTQGEIAYLRLIRNMVNFFLMAP